MAYVAKCYNWHNSYILVSRSMYHFLSIFGIINNLATRCMYLLRKLCEYVLRVQSHREHIFNVSICLMDEPQKYLGAESSTISRLMYPVKYLSFIILQILNVGLKTTKINCFTVKFSQNLWKINLNTFKLCHENFVN